MACGTPPAEETCEKDKNSFEMVVLRSFRSRQAHELILESNFTIDSFASRLVGTSKRSFYNDYDDLGVSILYPNRRKKLKKCEKKCQNRS